MYQYEAYQKGVPLVVLQQEFRVRELYSFSSQFAQSFGYLKYSPREYFEKGCCLLQMHLSRYVEVFAYINS